LTGRRRWGGQTGGRLRRRTSRATCRSRTPRAVCTLAAAGAGWRALPATTPPTCQDTRAAAFKHVRILACRQLRIKTVGTHARLFPFTGGTTLPASTVSPHPPLHYNSDIYGAWRERPVCRLRGRWHHTPPRISKLNHRLRLHSCIGGLAARPLQNRTRLKNRHDMRGILVLGTTYRPLDIQEAGLHLHTTHT